jgi:hypothetical protein
MVDCAERWAFMPFDGAVDRVKLARPRMAATSSAIANVAVLQLPLVVLLEQHRADHALQVEVSNSTLADCPDDYLTLLRRPNTADPFETPPQAWTLADPGR